MSENGWRARSARPDGSSYDEPFAWWGPRPPATVRTLAELVDAGVVAAEAALMLRKLVERRASIVVAAGPSGAGKTTLLTALAGHLPADTRRIFLRGGYETWAWRDDPAVAPERSALLVNEISPHLPVYLWEPGVRRALEAARDGFQMMATAHAQSAEEFLNLLAGPPLRLPLALIGAVDAIVILRRAAGNRVFRVDSIGGLEVAPAGGLVVTELWSAPMPGDGVK